MNDAEVIKIARRIDTLNRKITELVLEIEQSDHPNAAEIVYALRDNGFDNPAYATHCVSHDLENPDKWETGYFDTRNLWGIRRKRAQS
jgi:hypothetical protein